MANEPARSSFPAVVAIIGAFLVFSILLSLKYKSVDDAGGAQAAERPSLAEQQSKESSTLNALEVVDASQGKARLPIEQAKKLIVAEHAE